MEGKCNVLGSVSGSVINARVPFLFTDIDPGFLIKPWAVNLSMMCAWPFDGNSASHKCPGGRSEYCLPGCGGWCPAGELPNWAWCNFHPNELARMMRHQEKAMANRWTAASECHNNWQGCDEAGREACNEVRCNYNEVVLDSVKLLSHMPAMVEAIYYPANTSPFSGYTYPGRRDGRGQNVNATAKAIAVHAALKTHYGLDKLPLVKLDRTKPNEAYELMSM